MIVSKETPCKTLLLKKLKELSGFMAHNIYNVYDLHYENIHVPENYDTIKWQTEAEIITGLDSIHTQYMIFRSQLKALSVKDDHCKLHKSDFIKIMGLPTMESSGKFNDIFYHFNTKQKPDCYRHEDMGAGKYDDCSFLQFSFDSNNNLKYVGTLFLNP
jgi:hypothetical protein